MKILIKFPFVIFCHLMVPLFALMATSHTISQDENLTSGSGSFKISTSRNISFDGYLWRPSFRKPRFFDDPDVQDGLDPVEYIKKVRRKQNKNKKRRKGSSSIDSSGSSSSSSYKKQSAAPRAEFLLPDTYKDEPRCQGKSGSLSGFTFLNFMMSAVALGANIVSNINSNQRNNNNNNNDNNDNVNNFNFASNNNAGNNQNTIAICPFPCIPGPPGIPTGMGRRKRRRRRTSRTGSTKGFRIARSLSNKILNYQSISNSSSANRPEDLSMATIIAFQFFQDMTDSNLIQATCKLEKTLTLVGGISRAGNSLLRFTIPRLVITVQNSKSKSNSLKLKDINNC